MRLTAVVVGIALLEAGYSFLQLVVVFPARCPAPLGFSWVDPATRSAFWWWVGIVVAAIIVGAVLERLGRRETARPLLRAVGIGLVVGATVFVSSGWPQFIAESTIQPSPTCEPPVLGLLSYFPFVLGIIGIYVIKASWRDVPVADRSAAG